MNYIYYLQAFGHKIQSYLFTITIELLEVNRLTLLVKQ